MMRKQHARSVDLSAAQTHLEISHFLRDIWSFIIKSVGQNGACILMKIAQRLLAINPIKGA